MLHVIVEDYLKHPPELYKKQEQKKKKEISSKGFYLKSAEGCTCLCQAVWGNVRHYIQCISHSRLSPLSLKIWRSLNMHHE